MTWIKVASGTTEWLRGVAFGNGVFVAVPTIKSLFSTATQNGQLVVAGVEGVILRNQVVPHLSPVSILDYHFSAVVNSNSTTASVYELFLFGGLPDQFFEFQSSTNLNLNQWSTNAVMELFDSSGTIYLLRTQDVTNVPPAGFYRAQLLP